MPERFSKSWHLFLYADQILGITLNQRCTLNKVHREKENKVGSFLNWQYNDFLNCSDEIILC